MRKKTVKAGLIGMLVCVRFLNTSAGLIVEYNFTGGSANPSSKNTGISASSVVLENGWSIAGGSGTLFIQNPTNVPTGAVDLDQYVSFTIDPLEEAINYDSVSFRFGGDNTTSSMDYTVTLELRSSIDNFTSVLGMSSYTVLRSSGVNHFSPTVVVIDLRKNATLQGVGATTTFRLYTYDDSDYNTTRLTVRVDDIFVEGSIKTPTLSLMLITAVVKEGVFYKK